MVWWVPRYEGIRADRRGRTGRGKARRAFEARVPLAPKPRGSGAHGKPSKNVTLLAQLRPGAHLHSFISVNLFVGGAAPALYPWPGNRPVLTRHRDNIAPRINAVFAVSTGSTARLVSPDLAIENTSGILTRKEIRVGPEVYFTILISRLPLPLMNEFIGFGSFIKRKSAILRDALTETYVCKLHLKIIIENAKSLN